ncbi:ketohexokinase-like [Glandiceps talaboti]
MNQKKILQVGLTCLDILNVLEHYPLEDTDSRCKEQYWQRGGNAGNTSVVLAQLGVNTEYLGTLAEHQLSQFIKDDLHKHGVKTEHCVYHSNANVPTSCILVNSINGSRTIVHANKNLPELRLEDFQKLQLCSYHWIHFEGRNLQEVLKMIDAVEMFNETQERIEDKITVSIELEKPKHNIHDLIDKGNVVFISKDYAKHFGYNTAEEALKYFHQKVRKGAILVCAWGDLGAWAMDSTDQLIFHSEAFPPKQLVDTLGAGDTFNAGVIYSLSQKQSLQEALTLACKLAGRKCELHGFIGVTEGIL